VGMVPPVMPPHAPPGFPGSPFGPPLACAGAPMHGLPGLPGLPGMPAYYGVPPPMPPPNFSGMTDQELRDLEGNERANVEARVKCLRNIQVLLDAAVLEMQQYSSVISRLNTTSAPAGTQAPAAAAQSTTQAVRTPAATPSVVKKENESKTKPTEQTGAVPKKPRTAATAGESASETFGTATKSEAAAIKEEDKEAEEIIKKMDGSSRDQTADKSGGPENQDEIRRRRLEKLQQNQQS